LPGKKYHGNIIIGDTKAPATNPFRVNFKTFSLRGGFLVSKYKKNKFVTEGKQDATK
jgi:endoglucanase Acf2